MKLVEAVLVETGYVEARRVAAAEQLAEVPTAGSPVPIDCSARDELGRFLPSYNERFRKADGDVIGPGFASVETKRIGLDPRRLHINGAR
ncbi:MAG: hypothetical protein MUF54_25710 [Polyangiaceae bacterium]|jgi:hypothetical protein|nr:hypothetical protein [Polyangiaceae bacterium]